MKYRLLLLSLLPAAHLAEAQHTVPATSRLPVDTLTHRITYTGGFSIPYASQFALYARGQRWFATPAPRFITPADFPSARYVTQADEQQGSFLTGEGFASTKLQYALLLFPARVRVWCTIRLTFVPGSYRYCLTDFFFREEPGIRYHKSNLPHGSVEHICLARRSDGQPTRRATKFALGLDQAVQRLVISLQGAMSNTDTGQAP